MKRMIDYKEFLELQNLANINEQRIDYIEGAYTYFHLGLDDANFDHLLPSAPEDLSPQTLEIGDTVYIEGVATTLDADMIKEIFDSNLVILDCGAAPTNYPTVFLQRQYIDEDTPDTSPRSAQFKAFVTIVGAVFIYTMTVTPYDATEEEGGFIAISCKENATKPVYWHTLKIQRGGTPEYSLAGRFVGYVIVLNNSSQPITETEFKTMLSTPGFFAVVINGKGSNTGGSDLQNLSTCVALKYSAGSAQYYMVLRDDTTNIETNVDLGTSVEFSYFEDLGANRIN